jgi:hypothetical protein
MSPQIIKREAQPTQPESVRRMLRRIKPIPLTFALFYNLISFQLVAAGKIPAGLYVYLAASILAVNGLGLSLATRKSPHL